MRIKFLAIIASFIFVSIAISSCLDSDDNTIELSSDATVHAFGIDTIYGKYYKFTIDQLKREIYNQDSLPVGSDTILDRILIDTFLVSGWITAGIDDTIFVNTDSVDLTGAINSNEGMNFKVHAPDGVNVNKYTLKIRMHKQDPDSLVWNLMEPDLPAVPSAQGQKAVLFNNDLWVFTQSKAYKTSTKPGEYGWQKTEAYIDFPSNAELSTLVSFKYQESSTAENAKERLYIVTEDNNVYTSDDGVQWAATAWNGISHIRSVIPSFTNTLTIITTENKIYSAEWDYNDNKWNIAGGTDTYTGFPAEHIYFTNFKNNNQERVMVVGAPNSEQKQTIPWVSENGNYWVEFDNTSYEAFCPALKNPVVTYYGEKYYIFGSKEDNKLNVIYSSPDGISWRQTKSKFLLSKDITGINAPYSIVVNTPYIWVIFGGDGKANEVWRGHQNKLLFAIQ